ncbi:MAG: hypothetical protein ABJC63_13530 [Gemmatimonadales bacterium]
MAFSFPAVLCWIFGGAAGGIAVAWSTQYRSWPIALSFLSLTATIRKTAGHREKDSLIAMVSRSPLVVRAGEVIPR